MWVVLFITSDVDGQSCYAAASDMINVIMIASSIDQTLLSLPVINVSLRGSRYFDPALLESTVGSCEAGTETENLRGRLR